MAAESSSRKFVYAGLDEITHIALLRLAVRTGAHPADIVADSVIEYVAHYADAELPGQEQDPYLLVYLEYYGLRRRERARNMLIHLTRDVLEHGTDEDFDKLRNLADMNGVTVEELSRLAQSTVPLPAGLDDGYGVASAMLWLTGLFHANRAYPVHTLREEAEKRGFTRSVLEEARRNLGIQSRKAKGRLGWDWVLDLPETLAGQQVQ